MNPRAFFLDLLARENLTPSGLAIKLKDSGKTASNIQPQLSRWLNNPTLEPSMRTMKPVANYFRVLVDAFYDPAIARTESQRLKSGAPLPVPAQSGAQAWPFSVSIDRFSALAPDLRDDIGAIVETLVGMCERLPDGRASPAKKRRRIAPERQDLTRAATDLRNKKAG